MGQPAAVPLEPGVSKLAIENVSRTFPGVRGGAPTRALEPINLAVADNDFVTILGPSGCGKSTCCGWSPGSTRRPPAASCSTARR